jgi:hypothetical protein
VTFRRFADIDKTRTGSYDLYFSMDLKNHHNCSHMKVYESQASKIFDITNEGCLYQKFWNARLYLKSGSSRVIGNEIRIAQRAE